MTRYWPAGSVEATLAETMRELSDAEIQAFAPSLTRGALRKQITHGLHFEAAVYLDRALRAKGLQPRFQPLFTTMTDGHRPPPLDIEAQLFKATAALGVLAKIVDEALADGRLDPHELRGIAKAANTVGVKAWALRDEAEQRAAGNVTAIPVKGKVG